jgi:acetyl-CoA synthetase
MRQFPGYYFTGDGVTRDADGFYWITGRVDDVINVSGHRIGTSELEGVLTNLDEVVECAVVGYPHETKARAMNEEMYIKVKCFRP